MSESKPSVTVMKNGPLIVTDVPTLVLPDGTQSAAKPMMALCRCGHSGNKPFCDGSHEKVGWTED